MRKRKKDTMSNRFSWHLLYLSFALAVIIIIAVALTNMPILIGIFGTWFPVAAVGIRSHYVKARDENIERFKSLGLEKKEEDK